MRGSSLSASIPEFANQRSPWTSDGFTRRPSLSRGRSRRGITVSNRVGIKASNSGSYPLALISRSSAWRMLFVKNVSQLPSQSVYCGRFPAYVVTWNPNLPVGLALFWCSADRRAANLSGSGMSGLMSRYYSCSLLSMSRPMSLDCTLMKKVQGEPSASSASILPVLAQKLTP
jgi:hypothetical protein